VSQQTCAEAHGFEHERAKIPIPAPDILLAELIAQGNVQIALLNKAQKRNV